MDLEEIQSARSRERRTDSLQPLADSFYEEAGGFVRELRAKRKEVAAEADDPFDSPEVRRLTNSIETAENTVEAIYERRVGKVLKLASLDAAGMRTDDGGLTPEERDLLGTLTDAIERNREQVIEGVTTTEGATGKETEAASETDPTGVPDRTAGADAGAVADDAVGAGAPETPEAPETSGTSDDPGSETAGTSQAPEAPDPPAEEPAGGRAEKPAADRREGESNAVGDGPTAGEEDLETMGAADAMGAPAGTASASNGESEAGIADDEPPGTDAVENNPSEELAGTGPTPPGSSGRSDPSGAPEGGEAGNRETAEVSDRETIRVTRDVGEIVGIDERVYELASEDVVRLPAANAKPLIDRDAAERLE